MSRGTTIATTAAALATAGLVLLNTNVVQPARTAEESKARHVGTGGTPPRSFTVLADHPQAGQPWMVFNWYTNSDLSKPFQLYSNTAMPSIHWSNVWFADRMTACFFRCQASNTETHLASVY